MTRDDIIKIAREADIIDFRDDDSDPHVKQMIDMLQGAVERAVAQEREVCAAMALINGKDAPTEEERDMAVSIATAIRARQPCLSGEPLANQAKTSGSPMATRNVAVATPDVASDQTKGEA